MLINKLRREHDEKNQRTLKRKKMEMEFKLENKTSIYHLFKHIITLYKRYDKDFDVRDYYFDIGERHYVNEKSVYFAEQKIYHLRYQDY